MGSTLRIYLDACAVSRLTDDPSQSRIRLEAEAMEHFFRHLLAGRVRWISISILELEIRRNPDAQRRDEALRMLVYATEMHLPDAWVKTRARLLQSMGYGPFDALHLAIVEHSKADLLLTTDDRFLRQVRRGPGKPSVRAANPLDYLQETKP